MNAQKKPLTDREKKDIRNYMITLAGLHYSLDALSAIEPSGVSPCSIHHATDGGLIAVQIFEGLEKMAEACDTELGGFKRNGRYKEFGFESFGCWFYQLYDEKQYAEMTGGDPQ